MHGTTNIKYRTIFVLVLYGCETWSLILREKRRLRMSENRVLKRIFGPRRDEEAWEWRKLLNEEKNEMGGACSTYGRKERSIQGFGG